jgi:DNA-binding NarL/FixJ family response regulator
VNDAVRCLVADDHPALAWSVSARLRRSGYRIVGPAADGHAAVRLAAAERPEAAVVDLRMPHLAGPKLIGELRAVSPGTSVCVYTADADETTAQEALAAGAAAVVLKDASLASLERALAATLAGGSYLDPGVAPRPRAASALTERELDVLLLLAEGLKHEEIGARLGIGSETVRTHLRKACTRLGAATRTQAVATALRQGLIA